jgi:signal transduction histidine kinase
MKSITSRFVMFMATAAVAPLVVYGVVSIGSLWEGTRRSVETGNRYVAMRASEEIQQYVLNLTKVLQSLAAQLENTSLRPWQQDRIIKNYVLDFPEFQELTLFDENGRVTITSRVGKATLNLQTGGVEVDGAWLSPISIDDDLLPTTTARVPVRQLGQTRGWLVGELNLEHMWRMVDDIRVGERGFALVVAPGGLLVAHGDPDKKDLVARGDRYAGLETLRSAANFTAELATPQGTVLAVAAPMSRLDWTVVVEQPTSEAYQVAWRLGALLLAAVGLALLVTITVGSLWGRSFIRRIGALARGTRALAEGHFDERVSVSGQDEISALGASFNTMADRLVELQEDVRKQERQAMFGKVAAGLVHDLSHPIQTIVNNSKLIVRMYNDADYREQFRRTIDRESATVKRVLDDLRNIARPIPLERFPVDVNRSVSEIVESMQTPAETAGLTLQAQLPAEPLFIEGDLFALGRVYRNLIMNAIQATAPGGLIAVETEAVGGRVQIRVYDTGCGIAPERLGTIFDDFITTKRRGLGLGLAISKKIVEQLGGRVSVASEVGKGTTFVLDFPATAARPAAEAADRIA